MKSKSLHCFRISCWIPKVTSRLLILLLRFQGFDFMSVHPEGIKFRIARGNACYVPLYCCAVIKSLAWPVAILISLHQCIHAHKGLMHQSLCFRVVWHSVMHRDLLCKSFHQRNNICSRVKCSRKVFPLKSTRSLSTRYNSLSWINPSGVLSWVSISLQSYHSIIKSNLSSYQDISLSFKATPSHVMSIGNLSRLWNPIVFLDVFWASWTWSVSFLWQL